LEQARVDERTPTRPTEPPGRGAAENIAGLGFEEALFAVPAPPFPGIALLPELALGLLAHGMADIEAVS